MSFFITFIVIATNIITYSFNGLCFEALANDSARGINMLN